MLLLGFFFRNTVISLSCLPDSYQISNIVIFRATMENYRAFKQTQWHGKDCRHQSNRQLQLSVKTGAKLVTVGLERGQNHQHQHSYYLLSIDNHLLTEENSPANVNPDKHWSSVFISEYLDSLLCLHCSTNTLGNLVGGSSNECFD